MKRAPAALPSPDEVRPFEVEIGFDLPDDYRAFLLGYDGGTLRRTDPVGGEGGHLAFRAEAAPPLHDGDAWIAPGGYWDVALFHGLVRPKGGYGPSSARNDWRERRGCGPWAGCGWWRLPLAWRHWALALRAKLKRDAVLQDRQVVGSALCGGVVSDGEVLFVMLHGEPTFRADVPFEHGGHHYLLLSHEAHDDCSPVPRRFSNARCRVME